MSKSKILAVFTILALSGCLETGVDIAPSDAPVGCLPNDVLQDGLCIDKSLVDEISQDSFAGS